MFSDFLHRKFKPYLTVDEAIDVIASTASRGDIKIVLNEDVMKTQFSLNRALQTSKAFKTIEDNFDVFRKKYNIEYVSKLFWDDTTWEISYNYSQFKYTIKSGSDMGGWGQEYKTRKNEVVYISSTINSQIVHVLYEAKKIWPSERFDIFYSKFLVIAQSGTRDEYSHLRY